MSEQDRVRLETLYAETVAKMEDLLAFFKQTGISDDAWLLEGDVESLVTGMKLLKNRVEYLPAVIGTV